MTIKKFERLGQREEQPPVTGNARLLVFSFETLILFNLVNDMRVSLDTVLLSMVLPCVRLSKT